MEIASQIFGIIAFIITIICFQFNTQKKIVICQVACSLFFLLSLVFKSAYSGALLNVHGIIRSLIFTQRGKNRIADSPVTLVVLCMLTIPCVAFTYRSPLDLLCVVGQIATTVALYMKNPAKIRLVTLISPPCWFIYHFSLRNIGGYLNEIFVVISILTAVFRYDILKKGNKDEQPTI